MHIKFWLESLKGKYHLRSPTRRREDNIKMDLREIGCNGIDWIHLATDMDQLWGLVNTVP